MKWIPATGVKPRTRSERVFVRYRCGHESKQAYPVRVQRWTHTADPWDIVAYRAFDEREAA